MLSVIELLASEQMAKMASGLKDDVPKEEPERPMLKLNVRFVQILNASLQKKLIKQKRCFINKNEKTSKVRGQFV